MEENLKRLVLEILTLTLLLIIVIPVCVHASSNYKLKKEVLKDIGETSIDISNKGDVKEVTVYSNSNQNVKVYLILQINKFSDDYWVRLDEHIFDINTLEYTEDEDSRYYNLGSYDINLKRTFEFQLKIKDIAYYDETLTYRFITEGVL